MGCDKFNRTDSSAGMLSLAADLPAHKNIFLPVPKKNIRVGYRSTGSVGVGMTGQFRDVIGGGKNGAISPDEVVRNDEGIRPGPNLILRERDVAVCNGSSSIC